MSVVLRFTQSDHDRIWQEFAMDAVLEGDCIETPGEDPPRLIAHITTLNRVQGSRGSRVLYRPVLDPQNQTYDTLTIYS